MDLMVKQVRMVPVRLTEVFSLRIRVKTVIKVETAAAAVMVAMVDMLLKFMPIHT